MAEATVSSPAPRPKRRGLRAVLWVVGVLVLLLVVAYFVGTSASFLKGVILPKASASLNAKITVSDASISPFSQVILKDLKVETTGTEPLVAAPEVRLHYSLMDIIRGNIKVDEVTLNSPTLTLVQNPDGTSNLDPILKSQQQKPAAKPQEPAKPSKPMQIDVRKVAINNATVRQIKLYKGGNRDLAELSNLNLTLDNLKNGQTGKIALAADIKMENNPPAPGTNGLLQARLNGTFDLALTSDLKPATIQGNTGLNISRAEGALAQAAAFGVSLDCNITPTDIKQVAVHLQKGQTPLGEVQIAGPFNIEKMEGKISVQVLNIDKNVLNLAGASSGLDFGPTTINSSNQVELAHAGDAISLAGQFNLNQLQLTRTNQTTPPMDLRANYDLTVDRSASNAVIRTLALSGVQKQNQFLRGELTSPMTVSWGNTANAVGDSALNVTVSHFDLADWKAFLGDVAPTGDVNAKVKLLSQKSGKQLTFDVDSQIANLTVIAGSNRLAGAAVTVQLHGDASDMSKFNLPQYRFELAQQNQPVVTVSGSATYDKAATNADAQVSAQVVLARLLQAFPQPDVTVSSGTIDLKTHVVQHQADQSVTGTFALADFSGRAGSNVFKTFGTSADFDVAMNPQQVQIKKVSGKVTEGANVGGTFDLNGNYGLNTKAAQLTAKLANFNQVALHTFLEPMLGDKKLVSVALNANASVQYDPSAASTVKADFSVTNLVVNDPKGQIPATPLETKAQVDVGLNKQVVEVRQCTLSLTPTARAANQVQLTGRVDMTQPNAMQGNLKLAADSLDFTTYYDLFTGKPAGAANKQATTTGTAAPSPTPPTPPSTTPPTNSLPMRNFSAELAIGKLYLHELEVTNWQTLVKIDGGKILVNPCKLNINGAPASSTVDLDLGVPGYKYDVALSSAAIPLAPVVNSLSPENKGLLSGTLTAQGKVTGTGTSGESLQKTLAGQFDLFSTNLNLSIDRLPDKPASARVVKALVSAITALPELVKNPSGATSLLSSFAGLGGSGGTNSGASSSLSKSPIDSIVATGTMGAGKVLLQHALVRSPAFIADVNGTVDLAPVMTNSTLNLPVTVYLERSLADAIKLAGNTPPNEKYAKMPQYLTMKGTVGDPKKSINYAAFAGTAAQILSEKAGKNSGLVQGLGNLLSGSGSAPAGGTNAPGTNRPAGANLGGLVQGLIGGNQGTNTPAATNATPPTNQSPVGNLLNDLLRPKKK